MVDSIEQRVLELINLHIAGVEEREVTETRPVLRQHAYEYYWLEDKEENFTHTEYDYTKREKIFSELIQIGKPAVPTLIKILISEEGEYPDEFISCRGGVPDALKILADTEVSKSLVRPFQEKLEKTSEKNYLYDAQIFSIADIWTKYPVPEAIPALYAAITKKTNEKYHFGEYDRKSFFNALARIGTKEAITAILTAGKQDAHLKHEYENNRTYAIRILEKSMEQNGKTLYEIYGTTEDAQIKEIASEALSWTKSIYWLIKKLHL